MPVPVRPTEVGLPIPLLTTVNAALRLPVVVGVNVTLIWQWPLIGIVGVGPQRLLKAKSFGSAPVMLIDVTVRTAVP
jgi:hypothetical protein